MNNVYDTGSTTIPMSFSHYHRRGPGGRAACSMPNSLVTKPFFTPNKVRNPQNEIGFPLFLRGTQSFPLLSAPILGLHIYLYSHPKFLVTYGLPPEVIPPLCAGTVLVSLRK